MEKEKAKRRLVFVEELSEQVNKLEAVNVKLVSEMNETRSALRYLVEACEAGGTSRYMEALGRARRLLDEFDAVQDARGTGDL